MATTVDFVMNGFQAHVFAFLKDLGKEDHFSDVTLVSEDNLRIKAHKVVLSSFSSFFRNIFMSNPHPSPMLFMKGASYGVLCKILDFIYTGEATVRESDIQIFLDLTKYFEIDGFVETAKKINSADETICDKSENIIILEYNIKYQNPMEPSFVVSSEENTEEIIMATKKSKNVDNPQNVDNSQTLEEVVKSQSESLNIRESLSKKALPPKVYRLEKRKSVQKKYCDQCTYNTGYAQDLKKHIESVHMALKHACTHCDYIAHSKSRVEEHKYKKHCLPMLDL